ncbi:MAG: PKD domain-containing protein [Bacteroidales bacterium]|nr:PKD domain-containing protein [Bacteroidales bacterium]
MKRTAIVLFVAGLAALAFSSCKKDTYVPTPPTASFTVEVSAYNSYTVYVTDNSSYDVTDRVWDWGDGTSETGYQSSHTYSRAGTYTISLKVTNYDGLSDYASKSVTITAPGGGGDNPGGGGGTTTYTQVKITSLTLREFPAAPSSGGSWDVAGKPDIYFKIMDGNATTTYYTSATKEDVVNSDCPLYYTGINYTLYNLTATYRIAFYDDDNIDVDELMVACNWTPSTENNNHGSSFNWVNSNYDIDFTLYLTWYSSKGEALYTKPAHYKNGKWLTNDAEVMRALNIE